MGNELSRCVDDSGAFKGSKSKDLVRREGKFEEVVLQNAANALSDILKPKRLVSSPVEKRKEPKKEFYKVGFSILRALPYSYSTEQPVLDKTNLLIALILPR